MHKPQTMAMILRLCFYQITDRITPNRGMVSILLERVFILLEPYSPYYEVYFSVG